MAHFGESLTEFLSFHDLASGLLGSQVNYEVIVCKRIV